MKWRRWQPGRKDDERDFFNAEDDKKSWSANDAATWLFGDTFRSRHSEGERYLKLGPITESLAGCYYCNRASTMGGPRTPRSSSYSLSIVPYFSILTFLTHRDVFLFSSPLIWVSLSAKNLCFVALQSIGRCVIESFGWRGFLNFKCSCPKPTTKCAPFPRRWKASLKALMILLLYWWFRLF